MISSDRLQKALTFLAETDEPCAEAKGQVARMEYTAKLARSKLFLVSTGSVEARKALAEVSPEVQKAEDNVATAIVAFERVKARRATEELIVEVWRSMNANRRQGNVT